MKKIITAMGNENLNNELKKYSKYDLNEEDLYYQEAVLDTLREEKYDTLIISSLLQGEFEFGEFIEKVRKVDKSIRVIIVADELNDFLKRKLKDSGVEDIFYDETVSVSDIVDAIDREEPILAKYSKEKEDSKVNVSEEKEENYFNNESNITNSQIIVNEIVQKQEVIAVSGTNGAGKSTFLVNFAKILKSNTKSKILLIDLDTLSGNLDELLDIHKVPQNVEILIDEDKKCGLNYAAELISRNRFDVNIFDELVINVDGVDVLTGNTSLHYCQNVLSDEHYDKILECAKERYDFILIDTSSNIFLDSTKWAVSHASRVFFVTENNFISMKKANQLTKVFTDNWRIWKSKIEIVINKERSDGIELDVVEKVLEDFKVIGSIRVCEENDEQQYIKILETINYIPKQRLITKLFSFKNFDGLFPKNSHEMKMKRNEAMKNAN